VLGITAASSVPQAAALRRCVAAAAGGGAEGTSPQRKLPSPAAVTEPLFQLAVDRLRAMAFVGLQEQHAEMTRDFAASRGISLQSLSHSAPPPPTPVEAPPEFEVMDCPPLSVVVSSAPRIVLGLGLGLGLGLRLGLGLFGRLADAVEGALT